MKKLTTKRIIAMLLALVLCIGAIPFASIHVSAATSSTVASTVSTKLPLVTYAMPLSGASRVYSYSSSSLVTKTTGYYIDTYTDQIVITQISSNGKAVYVTYPSSSASSGYRSRWFATDDILGIASVNVKSYTAGAASTTYRMSSSSGVKSYGSIAKSDSCSCLGSHTVGSKKYYPTIYPISTGTYNKVSGVKYKLALATSAPTTSNNSNTWTATVTINATSLEEWSTEIKQAEMSVRGVGHLVGNVNGTWIESNVIVGREILSYKRIKVFIPGYGPVTSNSTYGKTVYVNIPYKIRYTVHKHEYGTKSNTQYWGNFMVGLVNMKIVHTQQCSCGKAYTCTWEMPDMTIEKVNIGQTYTVTSRVYQK